MLKKLLTELENYFLPIRCCSCLKIGFNLCPTCRVKLKRITNFCLRCGQKSELGLICLNCKQEKDNYEACFFLGSSEDYIIKKSLFALKFKRDKGTGIILGKILGKQLSSHWPGRPKEWWALEPVIVPLPIRKKSENRISFNPSEIIALGLPQTTEMKILSKKLKITKDFFKKETKFSWQGEILEKALVIVISETMPKTKILEDAARTLKDVGAEKIIFISITN